MINVKFLNYSHCLIETYLEIREEIADYFTFTSPGARFNRRFKANLWDGKISLLNKRNGKFPVGLIGMLKEWASETKYELTIDEKYNTYNKIELKKVTNWVNSFNILDETGQPITPHDYQIESLFNALKNKKSLEKLPTSAGKSLIISLIVKYFLEEIEGHRVLVLTPTENLRLQVAGDFVNYNLFEKDQIVTLKGKEIDSYSEDEQVIVTTWQSAIKQDPEWFDQFDMLITDEVHLGDGKSLSKICENLINCEYKIGFTGTLKPTKISQLQLTGLYGPVHSPITTKEMIERGAASDIEITNILIEHSKELRDEYKQLKRTLNGSELYKAELDLLLNNQTRNNLIAKLAGKDETKNTLVLFRYHYHGDLLEDIINKMYPNRKVFLIHGKKNKDILANLRKISEKEEGLIIIASYGVLSTGLSVKKMHRAIFASPVKSEITTLQSLGRLLRKHKTKAKAILIDLIDDLRPTPKSKKNHTLGHGLTRMKAYMDAEFKMKSKRLVL